MAFQIRAPVRFRRLAALLAALACGIAALMASLANAAETRTLWTGDATKPLYEQWASISDQEHCSVDTGPGTVPDSRITIAADARFANGVAIHYHMNAGDHSCFAGRSEVFMGPKFAGDAWPYMILRGNEGWYAFQVLYPSDYPLNSATVADGGTMQFHGYGGSSTVPFGITAGRSCEGGQGPGTPHEGGPELGYLKAWIKAGSPEVRRYCLSREIHANTVYDILIHVRFSDGSDGFCEVFLNGSRVMDFTGGFGFVAGVNSILRSGLYPDTARSESPAMDLYEAGWTLAATREAAEASAFGLPAKTNTKPSLPTTATISALGETNSIFTVGPSSTSLAGQTAAKRHKQGTVFSFQLDQPATVRVVFQTNAPGRRVGNSCRTASRRLRRRPRCTATITIATLTRSAHAGLNKVAFSGRLPGKVLKPGRYQAAFTAIDSAGSAPPSTLSFTVVER
jgi:hypothetical protein